MSEKPRSSWRAECDMTVWLFLRVLIARGFALIPTTILINNAHSILAHYRWVSPVEAPSTQVQAGSLALGLAMLAIYTGAPLVWLWPVGRYLDTGDEGLRATALKRFAGINRFFAAYFCVMIAHDLIGGIFSGAKGGDYALSIFGAYYGCYFTLLTLEPILLNDVGAWLNEGERAFERKKGPIWSVRAKLVLLIANLIVIPMALVTASLKLGLTGWSQGAGVAVLTAVMAVGYGEMLYRGLARPLEKLGEKMKRVAAGDYAAKASVLADDEIGELRSGFNEMVDGLAERERLKDTFGRFVSVEIAKRLIESKELALGGENIEATVLFSDIRDFTPLSESLSPQELVTFLNDYFSFVTEPITRHNGVVNKFIGDAVMAIFAPQFGSKDHAADALAAAGEMRTKLAEFNASRPGKPIVRFGIGVHTGLLVAGNIGTAKRMEYTVIGDTVNVAARIESKTKDLACDLAISESVYAKLDEATRKSAKAERCDGVHVKGKEAALTLYKIG